MPITNLSKKRVTKLNLDDYFYGQRILGNLITDFSFIYLLQGGEQKTGTKIAPLYFDVPLQGPWEITFISTF